ncbi:MAG: phosphoenolpyruvate carboxykinase (ATP) [Pseudomonadota bacterium]|nr:phosphoenolpyruvate carboxykinase (ATP) [Pseudomonadota bacterium]MEC8461201.1 phosphoenolpyruvate carboxykinase (ATP) [Pseudomonadota bacterium]
MVEKHMVKKLSWTVSELIDYACTHEGARKTQTGGISVATGHRTGRSMADRFIVKDEVTRDTVDWGKVNQPYSPALMALAWKEVEAYTDSVTLFSGRYRVGADSSHGIDVSVETELAWHQLFLHHLFINLTEADCDTESDTGWSLLCLPGLNLDQKRFELNSDSGLFIDFTNRRILICGLYYAGEMKKSMFSVLNYLLPQKGVLPMHCASNVGEDGDVSLFFGLSGTGKTSLSCDINRQLIGDDEHGWSDEGVFNFEGGCYAKCFNLTQEKEPVIWDAVNKPGVVLENVVLDAEGKADFMDTSLSKNTRAAYDRSMLENCVLSNKAGSPSRIIFLTCDFYGVLPPVSMLSLEQVRYWFLIGYTAMIGNTVHSTVDQETSLPSIQPTFSACFGRAFFPLSPRVYAGLLLSRMQKSGAKAYLVNTGWYGGTNLSGGRRFDIEVSRKILDHIHSGVVDEAPSTQLPVFNLKIPKCLPEIPTRFLVPQRSWLDAGAYQQTLQDLARACDHEYRQYETVLV